MKVREEVCGMADEDKQVDSKIGKQHVVDPEKNEKAYEEKCEDNTGRDWTKRRTFLKDGEV
jgi:hypothetical protein